MIVGHVGYQQFPLLGFIMLVLFSKKLNILQASVILGIIGTLMIHQAGFYLAVIFALSLLMILPILYFIAPSIFEWRKFFLICLTGSLLVLLLSLSKLTAVFSFMRFFPREMADEYGKTYIQGLLGLFIQLLGAMIMIPFYSLNGINTNQIGIFLQNVTGFVDGGIWETDISLSPVIFFLLIAWVINWGVRIKKIAIVVKKDKLIAAFFLLLGLWLATDFSLAQGWIYQSTKSLPVLASLHVNVRFASAFIFPASLFAAYCFHVLSLQFKKQVMTTFFLLLSGLTIFTFSSYTLLDQHFSLPDLDLTIPLQTYDLIEQGRRYPIQNIVDVTDDKVFKQNASNLNHLNDAIFGYYLENFHPETKLGSVFEISNGYYNMTNPASYVFPDENNLSTFERFRVDQRDALELFIHRKQPVWKMSFIQNASNVLNLIGVIIVLIYSLYQMMAAGIHFLKFKSLPVQ